MKILPEHYQELKNDIQNAIMDNPELKLQVEQNPKINNKEIGYRWTLFQKVDNNSNNFKHSRRMYEYMNDDNIDSALKKIIKDITQ